MSANVPWPLTHFSSYHTKKRHINKNHTQFSENQNNWYRYTRWPFYKNTQTNGTQYYHSFFSSSLGVSTLGKLLSNATTELKKMKSKNYSCLFFPREFSASCSSVGDATQNIPPPSVKL
jgi:hypothetical protein